jgi:hypothetical protein
VLPQAVATVVRAAEIIQQKQCGSVSFLSKVAVLLCFWSKSKSCLMSLVRFSTFICQGAIPMAVNSSWTKSQTYLHFLGIFHHCLQVIFSVLGIILNIIIWDLCVLCACVYLCVYNHYPKFVRFLSSDGNILDRDFK